MATEQSREEQDMWVGGTQEHRKACGVSEPRVLRENIHFFQSCHNTDEDIETRHQYVFSNSLHLVRVHPGLFLILSPKLF